MIRGVPRLAAVAVAAAASATLIGGVALAGEPVNQGGAPGEPGTATNYCRTMPPQDDVSVMQCTARPGAPGAPGPAVDY